MRKLIRFLIKIGMVYALITALVDYFLYSYPVLLWSALALVFALFCTMIFNAIWESPASPPIGSKSLPADKSSEFTRLEHLIENAFEEDNPLAEEAVSERVRSLAFKAMSYSLNMPEPLLRTIAKNEPTSLRMMVRDSSILSILIRNHSFVATGRRQELEDCLLRVEAIVK